MAHVVLPGKRGATRKLADAIKEENEGTTEEVQGGSIVIYGDRIHISREMVRRAYAPEGRPLSESNVSRLFRWLMGKGETLSRIAESYIVFADDRLPDQALLVRFPADVKKRLASHAQSLGMSQNELVVMAVTDLVDLLESDEF